MILLLAACFSICLNNRFPKGTVVRVSGNSFKELDTVVEKGISNRGESVPLPSGQNKSCALLRCSHTLCRWKECLSDRRGGNSKAWYFWLQWFCRPFYSNTDVPVSGHTDSLDTFVLPGYTSSAVDTG